MKVLLGALRVVFSLMLCLGVALFGLDIAGLFVNMRNPEIYQEAHTFFQDDISLDEEQLNEALSRGDESDREYVVKITQAISQGIAHYWREEGIDKYRLRVPVFENYLLFLYSYLNPAQYERYEFCDHRRALERGVGLCSQHAIIACEVLERNGIDAQIALLSFDHVVTIAQVDEETDTWWVLDPDYGVVIDHDLTAVGRDPQIIEGYYAEAGYDAERISKLRAAFAKQDKYLFENARSYCRSRWVQERIAYVAVWIIPGVLVLTSILFFNRLRRAKSPR